MRNADHGRVGRLCQDLAVDLLNYFARRVEQPADAADLLSETFVVLCRRAGSIPSSDHEARLWAFGVARKVLSGHRRTRRRRASLVERLRAELSNHSTPTQDGSASDRVHDALAGLDHLDREIVRLVHWEGFTQAAVATILGIPAGTVRSRYTRARARLRQHLQAIRA